MDEQLLFDPAKMGGGPKQGELVYHYTSYHTASSFILGGKRQLLANTVRKMNDPMEHLSKFLLGGASVDLEHDEVMRIHGALNVASLENARLFCCSLDTPADTVDHPDSLIVRKPGRRGFDHPAMWAHYGDCHNGVCLILYRNALDETGPAGAFAQKVTVLNEVANHTCNSEPETPIFPLRNCVALPRYKNYALKLDGSEGL